MPYVLNQAKADVLINFTNQINKMKEEFAPSAVVILAEKKKGVRTMAKGREGLVRLVARIAKQHEQSLSRSESASDLSDALNYDEQLKELRQAIMQFSETVGKTIWGNSADAMAISDRFAKTLQGQRNNNTALDSALNEVDDWNKRYGPDDTDEDETEEPEKEKGTEEDKEPE